jgi:hypothetical protein
LPGDSGHIHVCQPINHDAATEINFNMVTGISEELLIAILRLLKKYLMDDSVKIVDMTSQALRVSEYRSIWLCLLMKLMRLEYIVLFCYGFLYFNVHDTWVVACSYDNKIVETRDYHFQYCLTYYFHLVGR